MNYIKQLQEENAELKARLSAINQELRELQRYLFSEKFYSEPYVNIRDVDALIAEAKSLSSAS